MPVSDSSQDLTRERNGKTVTIRTDFIDFPTGWVMQDEIGTASPPHHPLCSAHTEDGMFLCDCDAIREHWRANYAAV